MVQFGLNPQLIVDHKPMDRINAGRRLLPRVFFDAARCKRLRHLTFQGDANHSSSRESDLFARA